MYILRYTVYSVHYILYIVHCTIYNVSVHCKVYSVQYTVYIVNYILYIIHSKIDTVYIVHRGHIYITLCMSSCDIIILLQCACVQPDYRTQNPLFIFIILYTPLLLVHCTLYTVHCTVYSV